MTPPAEQVKGYHWPLPSLETTQALQAYQFTGWIVDIMSGDICWSGTKYCELPSKFVHIACFNEVVYV